jgi:hypothetical protein
MEEGRTTFKLQKELIELFDEEIGLEIYEKLQSYVIKFRKINGSSYQSVTINRVIDSILWYIGRYNPEKSSNTAVVNAAKLAYNKIIRSYFIRIILLNRANPEYGIKLFDIIAENISNDENFTIISANIDNFIGRIISLLGLKLSPATISKAKAEAEEAKARQQQVQAHAVEGQGEEETETFGDVTGIRGEHPSLQQISEQYFGDGDSTLTELILEIETENRGIKLDLTKPDIQKYIFDKLYARGKSYTLDDVTAEINKLLRERDMIDNPPGGAAAQMEGGGNKRIKSKKNSKRRYKRSKKRSNRRRRYSYKKY